MLLFYAVAPLPPSSIPTLLPNTTTVAKCSLLQHDTNVVNFGTTHLYIVSTDTHGPPDTSTP